MSKDAAKQFIEACKADDRVKGALQSLAAEEQDSFEAMVGLASGFGYEFTVGELEEALVEESKATRVFIEGRELSDEELQQVAGGDKIAECYHDYDPYSTCWFEDRCMRTWCYYPQHPDCKTTYDKLFDKCYFSDYCSAGTHTYIP